MRIGTHDYCVELYILFDSCGCCDSLAAPSFLELAFSIFIDLLFMFMSDLCLSLVFIFSYRY
jgi:hypothetical protein